MKNGFRTMILFAMGLGALSALAEVPRAEIPPEAKSYAYWNTKLSPEERVVDLLSHMTLTEKISELLSHGMPAVPRLGVAEYWWPGEAAHGIANIANWYSIPDPVSTIFPNIMGQGSTWNPTLIREMASMIGDEARAYYRETKKGLSHWAPTINIGRDPRWGRADEYYGEDPYLVTQMAGAFVDGFQYDSSSKYLKALAVLKHFACNSTENDRSFGDSEPDERDFYEYFGNQFEQIIENESPAGIMTAYNAIWGRPCAASAKLITDIGRDTYGFKGFFISDLGAIKNLHDYTKENAKGADYWKSYSAADWEKAVADPMKAGLNLELAPDGLTNGRQMGPSVWRNNALSAMKQGLITEDDIDKALFNLFVARFKTGEFDLNSAAFPSTKTVADYVYNDSTHQNEAISVAEQAVVLLENKGILPLKAEAIDSLVVVGQNADQVYDGPYISTLTAKKKAIEIPPYTAIKNKYLVANPKGSIEMIAPSADANGILSLSAEQLEKIKAAKAVILLLNTMSSSPSAGGTGSDFGEGKDRTTLDLPRGQDSIAQQVAAANATSVVYMMTGAQVNVASFNKKVGALLWCCYNGQGQGPACANLLFGAANPSGRLPMTWYADVSQLGDMYDNYGIRPSSCKGGYGKTYMYFTGDVTYPFGYGLGYSSFTLGKLSLDKTANVTGDDSVKATVSLTNSSAVDGYQVVQLYVASPSGYSERPRQRLAGFSKVLVPAGQTKTVTIPIDVSVLHFWDANNACFDFDLGTYTVKAGFSSGDLPTQASFNLVKGQKLAPKTVTLVPDRYVITAKGEKVATKLAVAMSNDKLYQGVSGKMAVEGAADALQVSYASSDPRVATVDQGGVVHPVGDGVTSITVSLTVNDTTKQASCPVVVAMGAK
jgi:Beta-glucosidase-related glycosidases